MVGCLSYALAAAVQAVLLVYLAIVLASALRGLARLLPGPATASRAFVVLALAGLTAGTLWWMGARVADQAEQFVADAPQWWAGFQNSLGRTGWGRLLLEDARSAVPSGGWLRTVGPTVFSVADGAVVLVLALFLTFEPATYSAGLLRLAPPGRRPRAREVLTRLDRTLGRWTLGRLGMMALTGVLTGFGLWAIGMPFFLVLGLLMGILSFIPNLGPALAALPAGLLALQFGPAMLGKVALVYLVTQLLDGFVLTPWVNRRTVLVPPALGLAAQLVFAVWFGTLGLIVATPVVATAMVLVQELYLKDMLGEEAPSEEG